MINPLFGFNPLPVINTKVTMTLDELLKTYTGRTIADTNTQEKYSDAIWDFDCGWYYSGDEQKAFEDKVIDHFRFRQIGFETPGRFIFEFRKKFKEIMPYYVQMYHSAELMDAIEDPLENYSMIEEARSSGSSNSSGSGTNSTTQNVGKRTHKHLDTPQGRIANMTDGYMSNADTDDPATDTESGTESSQSQASSNVETHLTRHGNIGVTTYAQMLEGYRQTFLNIDMMIIDEIDELFLQTF